MGEIVDLDAERAKRQAQKDRAASRPPDCPKAAPVIDHDWDDPPGMYVDGIFWPLYRLGEPDPES